MPHFPEKRAGVNKAQGQGRSARGQVPAEPQAPLGVTPNLSPSWASKWLTVGPAALPSADLHQGWGLLPQEAELIRNIQELLKRTIMQAVNQIRWVSSPRGDPWPPTPQAGFGQEVRVTRPQGSERRGLVPGHSQECRLAGAPGDGGVADSCTARGAWMSMWPWPASWGGGAAALGRCWLGGLGVLRTLLWADEVCLLLGGCPDQRPSRPSSPLCAYSSPARCPQDEPGAQGAVRDELV